MTRKSSNGALGEIGFMESQEESAGCNRLTRRRKTGCSYKGKRRRRNGSKKNSGPQRMNKSGEGVFPMDGNFLEIIITSRGICLGHNTPTFCRSRSSSTFPTRTHSLFMRASFLMIPHYRSLTTANHSLTCPSSPIVSTKTKPVEQQNFAGCKS